MKGKIQLLIKNINRRIARSASNFELNFSDVVFKFFLLLIILTLGYNIYNAYSKGQENLRRIDAEEQRLNQLIAENERLKGQEDYFSSLEYKRAYARDSWNLAEPGEKLFVINRYKEPEIEHFSEHQDPIPLQDHALWWNKLILGN